MKEFIYHQGTLFVVAVRSYLLTTEITLQGMTYYWNVAIVIAW